MRYRRRMAEDQPAQVIATARRVIALPLQEAPSVPEMTAELADREADLAAQIGRGEGRASTNLVAYQVNWLRTISTSATLARRSSTPRSGRRVSASAPSSEHPARSSGRSGTRSAPARRPRSRSLRATPTGRSATSRRRQNSRSGATAGHIASGLRPAVAVPSRRRRDDAVAALELLGALFDR